MTTPKAPAKPAPKPAPKPVAKPAPKPPPKPPAPAPAIHKGIVAPVATVARTIALTPTPAPVLHKGIVAPVQLVPRAPDVFPSPPPALVEAPNAPAAEPVASAAAGGRWLVVASAEVLGGVGSCGHAIRADGYSELSSDPNAIGRWDFAALGRLACGLSLRITNPANGRSVVTQKQDVGAGSSFLPVMGLYPATREKLGLSGGEFHVIVERTDGRALQPVRGTRQGGSSSGGGGASHPTIGKLYHNPVGQARVRPERIDQGVDYAGTGTYVAIADAVVTFVSGQAWQPYGNYVEYRITQDGPLKGVYVYYAEGINPHVHDGETIKGGQDVCSLIAGWRYGTECGFAAGDGTAHTYSYAHDGPYVEGTVTRPGIAFDNLVTSLGGPAGVRGGKVVGRFPGFAPDGHVGVNASDTGLTGSFIGITVPSVQASEAAKALDSGAGELELWDDVGHGARIGREAADKVLNAVRGVTFITNEPPRGF